MTEDDEIIASVLAGDREAFRGLVERYEKPVYRFVRNLLPDAHEAEDEAQETFLAAFRNLAAFDRARARFSTWLFTIARNRCLTRLRKKTPEAADVADAPARFREPPDHLADREFRERLDRALQALPPGQRTVFVLAEFAGLETDAIAGIEAVEPASVRSRLSRARASLRSALAVFTGGDP